MRSVLFALLMTFCAGAIAADGIIYRTQSCGCCEKWAAHMSESGFELEDRPTTMIHRLKERLGIPNTMHSCHTAVIDGYVVEGHVPASIVQRLLRERPEAVGISVPGMPPGSPGMEGPPPSDYIVHLIRKDGSTEVYEEVKARSGK